MIWSLRSLYVLRYSEYQRNLRNKITWSIVYCNLNIACSTFTCMQYIHSRLLACDHALSLYLCNLFSGGGHDTFFSQITCKKARIWSFFWLDRKQYGWSALFQLAKTPPSVVVVDFGLYFCLRIKQWLHTRVRYEISAGLVFLPVWKMFK